MKEKPIIFKDWEIRAIKENRKSQFRRIVKPQPLHDGGRTPRVNYDDHGSVMSIGDSEKRIACPYEVGSQLWVRETFASFPSTGGLRFYRTGVIYHCPNDPRLIPEHPYREVVYRADGEDVTEEHPNGATSKWRSPVIMPRWASRITLEITNVRVERLQEISNKDAFAEGTPCYVCGRPMDGFSESDCHRFHRKARASDYQMWWETIYSPDSWDANPWVWVYNFKKV